MSDFSDDEQRQFEEMTSGVELHQTIGNAEAEMRAAIGNDRYDEIMSFNDAVADSQLASSKAVVKVLKAKHRALNVAAVLVPALSIAWSVFAWTH